jgi:hypothetical protein
MAFGINSLHRWEPDFTCVGGNGCVYKHTHDVGSGLRGGAHDSGLGTQDSISLTPGSRRLG